MQLYFWVFNARIWTTVEQKRKWFVTTFLNLWNHSLWRLIGYVLETEGNGFKISEQTKESCVISEQRIRRMRLKNVACVKRKEGWEEYQPLRYARSEGADLDLWQPGIYLSLGVLKFHLKLNSTIPECFVKIFNKWSNIFILVKLISLQSMLQQQFWYNAESCVVCVIMEWNWSLVFFSFEWLGCYSR